MHNQCASVIIEKACVSFYFNTHFIQLESRLYLNLIYSHYIYFHWQGPRHSDVS